MRDREMIAWDRKHPPDQLDPLLAGWREAHPDGTLEDLVRDLGLWSKPEDKDAQRLVRYRLRALGDPAAAEDGHEMRAPARQEKP